jgi:purine-nucleoside/S-methyl-5'-thioadenosine phosphorylase / adenosine deaminase
VGFERRRLAAKGFALVSTELERDGFLAAFTERSGGVSPRPFDSLNLTFGVGDSDRNIEKNRDRVSEGLATGPFTTAAQIHGTRLVRVGEKRRGAGFQDFAGAIAGADGLYTSSAGVALAVQVADCMPIVMASPRQGLVAAVHAGWRGLASGILAGAASLFEEPKEVRVAIGPSIGPDHYEVGEDVALAVAAGSESGAVTSRRAGRTYLDLPGTARAVLRALGIRRVHDTGLCTACERRRFYSHRRDGSGGPTGRQAGIAMRL